ncbi:MULTISPECIES: hypothetical protein [unclassified Streptomyces]|uniref:hypothetical protein n=1 Tax=unclassified Streptomyces TaxID=2593676 RepID=UPI0008959184|nr:MULTISPECIES: hypothetical protein [unclassified Streptomyces]PKW06086.1 hypothetical protein BX260_1223 [Streptomyces sp. 5112.2]SEC40462.1 hypothetical protein SAMN05216532_1299 [Streptomyces sp. 2231.1]SED21513.1 hypothetical protein SAMN05428944_6872 [Streptomyces sp. 1222.5]
MSQIAPVAAANELLAAALREAMSRADRREPVGEAQFAVLEAAVQLIDADRPELADQPQLRTELLREALGSVRAAAVAAGVAVTRARQVSAVPA